MICPVCNAKLIEEENHLHCQNNHSFDKAKSGYINLLLNNHNSGDNKLMIDARNVILNKGYFSPLLEQIITLLQKYQINSVVDVGSGEGYYSRNIYERLKVLTYGIDISKYACLKASKQSQNVKYIVSSIFNLPLEDYSFDAIVNIFAPHSEKEFERICKGIIVKVTPNPHHLEELKEILYEDVYLKESTEIDFNNFVKIEEIDLTYQTIVQEVFDLIKMTPYYYKTKIDNSIFKYETLKVTMDFKIVVYEKRTL
jgi:23S rRNA (guanine745-N1)-methyltransferase